MRINDNYNFNHSPQPVRAMFTPYYKFYKTFNEFISDNDSISDEDIYNQTVMLMSFHRYMTLDNQLSIFLNKHYKDDIYPEYYFIHQEKRIEKSVLEDVDRVICLDPDEIKRKITRESIKNLDDSIASPYWCRPILGITDLTLHDIIRYFPLAEWQVGVDIEEILSDVKTIWFKIPDIENNIELLKKVMPMFGYFLSRIEDFDNKRYKGWKILTFEPKFNKYITEEIFDHCSYLYHVSPKKHEKKIMAQGLLPKSKNDYLDYPDRVYLLKDSTYETNTNGFIDIDVKVFERLIKNLYFAKILKKSNDYVKDELYNLYKIDLSLLHSSVNFAYDLAYTPFGIFTPNYINKEAIELIKTYDATKI